MSPAPATARSSTRICAIVAAFVLILVTTTAGVAAYVVTQRPSASDTQAAAPADDAVRQALRLGKPVVAEFGATSCENCRAMKPVLGALAREHGERMTVDDIDLLSMGLLAARLGLLLGALPGPWLVLVGALVVAAG